MGMSEGKARIAKSPEERAKAGKGGVIPPEHSRFRKGVANNPKGRPNLGASMIEHLHRMSAWDRRDLQRVAKSEKHPAVERAAAIRVLRMLEDPDHSDFESFIRGEATLAELRNKSINTKVVKRVKVETRPDGTERREIELRDTSGDDFDRLMEWTASRPPARHEVSGMPASIQVLTPGVLPTVEG